MSIVLGGFDFTPPTTAPSGASTTGGSMAAGDYQYKVTFTTQFGESTTGPASSTVTVAGNAVSLTSIPVSSDPYTDSRSIYCTAAGQPIFDRRHTD